MAPLAIDPDKGLIQAPPTPDVLTSSPPLPLPQSSGRDRTEPVPPETDGVVADVDASFVQQILDLSQ